MKQTPQKLIVRAELLKKRCLWRLRKPDASIYLPNIISSLDHIVKVLHSGASDPEYAASNRERFAGGMFRVVTDDAELAESRLGVDLLPWSGAYGFRLTEKPAGRHRR